VIPPANRVHDPDTVGRGLGLIRQLATTSHIRPSPHGTTVAAVHHRSDLAQSPT
jgi:hypothetical protein